MNLNHKIYEHLKTHKLYTVFDQRVVDTTNGDNEGQSLVLYTDGRLLFARDEAEFLGKFVLQTGPTPPAPEIGNFFGTRSVLQAIAGEDAHFGEFWFGIYAETKDAIYFCLPEAKSSPYGLHEWATEYFIRYLAGPTPGYSLQAALPQGASTEGAQLLASKIFKLKKLEKGA